MMPGPFTDLHADGLSLHKDEKVIGSLSARIDRILRIVANAGFPLMANNGWYFSLAYLGSAFSTRHKKNGETE